MEIVEIKEMPISLELAKLHLRLGDDASNDELVKLKLEMAISIAEDITFRSIQQKKMIIRQAYSDSDDIVRLPFPVSEITETLYFDKGRIVIPLEDNFAHYHSECEDILFLLNDKLVGKTIIIEFLCGYSSETIPPAIKAAILLILGTIYDNESNDVIGRITSQLSITAEKILQKYKLSPYV